MLPNCQKSGDIRRAVLGSAAIGIGLMSIALVSAPTPAAAQQHIDEPRLKPFLGSMRPPREDPNEEETEEENDSNVRKEETEVYDDSNFDNEKRWTPVRNFTGVLTFLAPGTTDLSIGAGPVYRPDYFGSDDYDIDLDPSVFVKFRNFTFFDDDGADIALFGFSSFRFGPSLRIVGDRREEENPALQGLGDIGLTFELGGFAAATVFDRYSIRFKVRKGIDTGHRGLIVDASTTALLFRWGPVSTSVTAQTSWIGEQYADTYFTVTPAQSAASGLPEYEANKGFRDIGGSLNGYINIRKRWSLNPYVSYNYVLDDIAATPIIDLLGDRHQFRAGFHIMREFELSMKR